VRIRKELHEWNGIPPWFWARVARELPPRKKTPFLKARRKGGRPQCDDRLALSAILWRLRSGATWNLLPKKFGSAATARRRQARWLKGDRLERAWRAYLYQLSRVELQRWQESFAAGAHRPKPPWRFGLDYVWKWEFAPLFGG
jgi:transposase